MNDYKNVFIFSFSLLIYVNSNNQRIILNVLLVHIWQSARIINYRNPQATFYTPCICKCVMMLYCSAFSVHSNIFVLCVSANTCKYVFMLYCNVFSVYLTLTFAAPHI